MKNKFVLLTNTHVIHKTQMVKSNLLITLNTNVTIKTHIQNL